MKQVIVVRKDLQLGKGKLSAHVAHASIAAYRKAKREDPEAVRKWEETGEKKVVVCVANEAELLELFQKIKAAGLPCELIKDAGLTQIAPGTITAVGIGPWDEEELDKLTGGLKLL